MRRPGPWPQAEKFIGHLTDDEGKDHFTATAFRGMRGLSPERFPEIVPAPPTGITHPRLIALGHAWVDTTNGQWRGYKDCGCKLSKYAIRLTSATEVIVEDLHFRNEMKPVNIPITFKDDGSFTGEASVNFQGTGATAD